MKNLRVLTVLYLLLAIVLPWSLAAMQIAFAMIIIYNIFVAVRDRKFHFTYHPIFIIIFIFLGFSFFSSLFSKDIYRSFNAILNTQWVLLMLPIFLYTPISEDERKLVIRALVFSSAIAAFYGILQSIIGIDVIRGRQLAKIGNYYRATGGYNFYLTFAGNLLLVFFPAFFLFLKEEKWNKFKILFLISLILILIGIISTFARSVWIALILVLFLGLILTNKKVLLKSLVPLSVIIVVASIIFPEIPDRFLTSFSLVNNETRLTIWKTSLNMISDNPLFGIGSGFFGESFEDYKAAGFYDTTTHAHNDYLNFAVNNGIIASLLWITLWVIWFYFSLKCLRNFNISRFDKSLLTGIVLSISGILVAAFFQCYYTDLENNIFWLFLVAISLQILFATENHNKT